MSVGNDIVDLNYIDAERTRSPRFYSKFISPAEVALYTGGVSTIPFEHFVWMLWSVKEAAYKCLQRLQPDLVFSPIKIQVTQFNQPEVQSLALAHDTEVVGLLPELCYRLKLNFNSHILYTRSAIYDSSLIHTAALFDNDFLEIRWAVKRIKSTKPEEQSAEVRNMLSNNLRKLTSEDLRINKTAAGIPFAALDDGTISVSISHHGNWIGYAFHYG